MARSRREFLAMTGSVGMAALAAGWPAVARAEASKPSGGKEPRISAPEDLMREHGVLDRLLLVYEEGVRRLRAKRDVPGEAFQRSAQVIRTFIEDYHEQVEEQLVFPELMRHGRLKELVDVLVSQHAAGRRLTDAILRTTTSVAYAEPRSRAELAASIDAFVRMYRPHEAFEETIVFPAIYGVVATHDLAELGEKAEEQEERRLGQGGFERTVAEVAAIEKLVDLGDLARFTPK